MTTGEAIQPDHDGGLTRNRCRAEARTGRLWSAPKACSSRTLSQPAIAIHRVGDRCLVFRGNARIPDQPARNSRVGAVFDSICLNDFTRPH